MSVSLSNIIFTGLLRRYDGTEAAAAMKADLDSFPPNPPPMRFVLQTTFESGSPST